MTPNDLLVTFRSEMNDEAEPQLWSDEEFYLYLDDAQKMFCRRTDGIGDASTPAVVQLNVVPNQDWYDTHPSILKIREASRTDTGREVKVLNREDMPEYGMRFDGRSGPLKALIIGMEAHRTRVWPMPSETVTVELLVFRLPLVTINDATGDDELEIDPQHHLHLLHWVKHRAYSKQDAEAFDKTKAAEFEQKFYAYCTQAQIEQRRARHKPRAVAYGGL